MNIVKSRTTLRVYGGSVKLMDRLEPRCYRYCYSGMGGPYLEEAPAPAASKCLKLGIRCQLSAGGIVIVDNWKDYGECHKRLHDANCGFSWS